MSDKSSLDLRPTAHPPKAYSVPTPCGVHQIRTLLGFPGVPTVNCYVIERPLTLVDAGLNSPASWHSFEAQLKAIGYRPEQFERILITHAHPDHFGFAERVRKLSGAQVYIGEHSFSTFALSDTDVVAQHRQVYRDYFVRLGLDDQVFASLAMMGEMMRSMAPRIRGEVIPVKDSDVIPFEDFSLQVLYTPGHTREIVCYFEPKQGFMFSSDHLLQETSPNPIIDLGPDGEEDYSRKFESLVSYYEQIQRVRKLDLQCVLPGHGLPFSGHDAVISSLLGFYELRQHKMLKVMDQEGPITVKRLAELMFPKAQGMQVFLAVCELLGNLEVMVKTHRVRSEFDGKVYLFEGLPSVLI